MAFLLPPPLIDCAWAAVGRLFSTLGRGPPVIKQGLESGLAPPRLAVAAHR